MKNQKKMNRRFPPAIPDGDISCLQLRFFEVPCKESYEIFDRRVVQHFRCLSKIELEGQVKLEDV